MRPTSTPNGVGRCGATSVSRGASSCAIRCSSVAALACANGSWPLKMWKKVVPSENRSERSSRCSPRACSGGQDRDDVRAGELGQDDGLAGEPGGEVVVRPALLARDLDGHGAVEAELRGQVNLAHAAGGQAPLEPVVAAQDGAQRGGAGGAGGAVAVGRFDLR